MSLEQMRREGSDDYVAYHLARDTAPQEIFRLMRQRWPNEQGRAYQGAWQYGAMAHDAARRMDTDPLGRATLAKQTAPPPTGQTAWRYTGVMRLRDEIGLEYYRPYDIVTLEPLNAVQLREAIAEEAREQHEAYHPLSMYPTAPTPPLIVGHIQYGISRTGVI